MLKIEEEKGKGETQRELIIKIRRLKKSGR